MNSSFNKRVKRTKKGSVIDVRIDREAPLDHISVESPCFYCKDTLELAMYIENLNRTVCVVCLNKQDVREQLERDTKRVNKR